MSQKTSLDNYKPMLKERGDLHMLKAQCEARIKELDKDLRPVLEGRGNVFAEGYTFKCSMQNGRKTLDRKAMEADGIDLSKYEVTGAPFTKMEVKKVDEA